MLKVIPVQEAIGMPLAHDITEIVPGKHKGPRLSAWPYRAEGRYFETARRG